MKIVHISAEKHREVSTFSFGHWRSAQQFLLWKYYIANIPSWYTMNIKQTEYKAGTSAKG